MGNQLTLNLNKRLTGIIGVVMLLLLVPLVAMQFTDEVNWKAADFLVMGTLLFVLGLSFDLVLRKVRKTSHRVLLCVGAFAVFLLVWAELAVGIFSSPFAGS